jgi:hypothetical protein
MVRQTRKHQKHQKHQKHRKGNGVYSIPELRRAFHNIEVFVDARLHDRESHKQLSKDLQKEWFRVFGKELSKASAEEFIQDRYAQQKTHRKPRRKGTLRGGASALSGATLDYQTRPGIYLAPESIPSGGHLPLSGGAPSTFGSYVDYVSNGFFMPQIAQGYDPIKGQSAWPAPGPDMGSNAFHKGGQQDGQRTKKQKDKHRRKTRRGGSMGTILAQMFDRSAPAASPPSFVQDMQDRWHGMQVGASPDQMQRSVDYQIGSVYPRPVTLLR